MASITEDLSNITSGPAVESLSDANGAVQPFASHHGLVVELQDRAVQRTFSLAENYAAAIFLFSQSIVHRGLSVGIVAPMVRNALALGQLRVFRKRSAPVGLAWWAYLSENVERRLLENGSSLRPNELTGGNRLWTVDVVAPFGGGDAMRKELAATLFGSQDYRELPRHGRPDPAPMTVSPVSSSVTYRPARREDIAALAPKLRRQDELELRAATGRSGEIVLSQSLDNAKRCWTALVGGQVAAMFGVGHMQDRPSFGRVWMLGSELVFGQTRALLHDAPIWLRVLIRGQTSIGNFVDVRNEAYIRWLKRMGFRFVRLHEQYGVEKQPFWEFVMTPDDLETASHRARGPS